MTDEQNQKTNEISKTEQYLNNWKRAEADLVNYRKGEAQRIQGLLKFGSESLIKEFVDVIDNFDIALKHAPPDTPSSWLEGLKRVQKQFLEVLRKHGVEKIETIGKPFDPVQHEVIETVAVDPTGPPGKSESHRILEEVRAGYMMYSKIIRPARVIISQ